MSPNIPRIKEVAEGNLWRSLIFILFVVIGIEGQGCEAIAELGAKKIFIILSYLNYIAL